MLISTPYYRSIVRSEGLGCEDLSGFTYGPYDIFLLETRLYPVVYKLFGRDVEMLFRTIYNNGRMELKIQIVRIQEISPGGEPVENPEVEMTEEQFKLLSETVALIVSTNIGYCLIDKYELYMSSGKDYPVDWFYSMMGYVDLPTEYNPFLGKRGIYLLFNPHSDYKTAYNKVVKMLLEEIDEYYRDGVVYGAGQIAEKWKLERMDTEEVTARLFRPMWSDQRFAPHPVEFLLEKIRGDPYIRVKVSDNLVKRHFIVESLTDRNTPLVFEGSYLKVMANGIDEAQKISTLIRTAENKDITTSRVVVVMLDNVGDVKLYIEAANELLGDPGCVGYGVSNPKKPYVFSCLIDINAPSELILEKLREMVLTKMLKQTESK